jgi:hypothetical protein
VQVQFRVMSPPLLVQVHESNLLVGMQAHSSVEVQDVGSAKHEYPSPALASTNAMLDAVCSQ